MVVQSGLKLYDFTTLAAGVELKKFVIRLDNGVIVCLFDLTEDRI